MIIYHFFLDEIDFFFGKIVIMPSVCPTANFFRTSKRSTSRLTGWQFLSLFSDEIDFSGKSSSIALPLGAVFFTELSFGILHWKTLEYYILPCKIRNDNSVKTQRLRVVLLMMISPKNRFRQKIVIKIVSPIGAFSGLNILL